MFLSSFNEPFHGGPEFDRVSALPMREPIVTEPMRQLVHSKVLKPGGKMRLWDVQIFALHELIKYGRLFGVIDVGGGKTLIAQLAATVSGAKRPLVLTLARLIPDAKKEFEKYKEHFNIELPEYLSYAKLSRPEYKDVLDKMRPDVIVLDEAHRMKNITTTGTSRLFRYLAANRDVKVLAMSGSITTRSIKDYAHIAFAALREHSFLPRNTPETEQWAEVLDAIFFQRPGGDMLQWLKPGEFDVRTGYKRRMTHTPGVVTGGADCPSVPLRFRELNVPRPPKLQKKIEHLNDTWERQEGLYLYQALELDTVLGQLFMGGCYEYVEVPPHEWLEARRGWHAACRNFMLYRKSEAIDSPFLLEKAIRENRIGGTIARRYFDWKEQQAKYEEPGTHWVWHSYEPVDYLASYAKKQPIIMWTGWTEFGKELAKRAEVCYYGAGQKAAERILETTGNESIVASFNAHGTGRNLQHFNRMAICHPIAGAGLMQQIIGRCHRAGQTKAVIVTTMNCYGHKFSSALDAARYIEATTGISQKMVNR